MNFPQLIKQLKTSECRDYLADPEFEALYSAMKRTWIKLSKLRNEAIGHISRSASQSDIFADSGLSAADVEHFLDNAVRMHRLITYPRTQCREAFNINGKPHTSALLKRIARKV